MLNLTYHRNGESYETARVRIDGVEELVRAAWANAGAGYPLLIERTITEVQ